MFRVYCRFDRFILKGKWNVYCLKIATVLFELRIVVNGSFNMFNFTGNPQLSYMVSYYPENETYVNNIASIVNWFRENAGYHMIMDKMATTEITSKGPTKWAESQIQKADKVLVFLSPGYNAMYAHDEEMSQNSSDDEKRVWYEMHLLKNMFCSTRSAAKIVCVVMDNEMDNRDLPPWAEVTYCWPKDKEKIIMRLNDISEIAPVEVAATIHL